MSSLARPSRIPHPVNGAVVPAAARQVSDNNNTAQSDLVSIFATMSLNKSSASTTTARASKLPILEAANKTRPVLAKQPSSSPSTTAATTTAKSVAARIQERKQRVVAKQSSSSAAAATPIVKSVAARIQERKQRVVAEQSSSSLSAAAVTTTAVKSVAARIQERKQRVVGEQPSSSLSDAAVKSVAARIQERKQRVVAQLKPTPPPVKKSPRPSTVPPSVNSRGTERYCAGRPSQDDVKVHGYEPDSIGRPCDCDPDDDSYIPAGEYCINPRLWATTPCEEDVDPKRPRFVKFAGVTRTESDLERYYLEAYGLPEMTKDWTMTKQAHDAFHNYRSPVAGTLVLSRPLPPLPRSALKGARAAQAAGQVFPPPVAALPVRVPVPVPSLDAPAIEPLSFRLEEPTPAVKPLSHWAEESTPAVRTLPPLWHWYGT